MAEPAAGRQPTVSARPAATTLILLTLSAGFVDAVGYLLVVSVFTGFMSGATLGTGLSLGQAQWITAFHRVIPIPAFIIGLFIGRRLLESLTRRGARSRLAPGLLITLCCVATFLVGASVAARNGPIASQSELLVTALLSVLAVGLGVQNATLRSLAGSSLGTTAVTGTLATAVGGYTAILIALHDRRNKRASGASPQSLRADLRQALLHNGVWLAYGLGALGGGIGELHWGAESTLLPMAALALVIARDLL